MYKFARYALACFLAFTAAAAGQTPVIPLRIDAPQSVAVTRRPLTVGVPFPQGMLRDVGKLSVVSAAGGGATPVATQAVATSRWRDGSVRWALIDFTADVTQTYAVAMVAPPQATDDIRIVTDNAGLTLTTGDVTYRFKHGQASFESIGLAGGVLVHDAGDAHYLIDSRDRRAVLQSATWKVELDGPRHVVLRAAGEYHTAEGTRVAAGTVYYHFYAGHAAVRVSHKIIITEHTNDLWFKDIGMSLPLKLAGAVVASFNSRHDDTRSSITLPVKPGAAATMMQRDFPHLGSTTSLATIEGEGSAATPVAAVGDWCDIAGTDHGLGAQIPAFAEQFPKAFVAHADRLTIKLWPGECGRELDFRTPQVIADYFGHDWISADHALNKHPNTAIGAARTHDIWLYPHKAGRLPQFGATRHETYAVADPQWVSDAGVMDAFAPADPRQFPRAEEVVRDFFLSHIQIPEQLFPNTGWLGWGRNPYTSAAWELRNGRWYPPLHRLSRCLDYNYKRAVWVLYARSGDRLYREHARRNARFLHDFVSSNWDSPIKPLGWFVQGSPFDSPAFWGPFDEQTMRRTERPNFIDEVSALGYGTSEDVIQYAYDYFMCGDFHSRDAVVQYKRAFEKEIAGDVDKLCTAVPSYVILRPMGSAYEVEPDDAFFDLGHRFLKRITGDGPNGLNLRQPQNYVKDGEIWAGFYHYFTSTGDELALKPMMLSAQHYYRTNRIEFIYRGSAQLQCFAMAYEKTGDPAYLAWLREGLQHFVAGSTTLRERGIDAATVGPELTKPWGHTGAMTTAVPVMIGIPTALRALAAHPEPTPRVPMAVKPHPTARTHLLFRKDAAAPARIDLYVNNFGDINHEPRVLDMAGKPVPVRIVAREFHRSDKPHGDINWHHEYNFLRGMSGDHLFVQLEVDTPPGVYELDAGDEVAFTVLYSDINAFQQVAPDGMGVEPHRDYFFTVPAGVTQVELFAHRGIELFDPQGKAVELTSLEGGRYRFDVMGRAGAWRFVTAPDPILWDHPYTRPQTFVRMLNIPTIIAVGDPSRLFEVDASRYASGRQAVRTEGAFGTGAMAQGVWLGRGDAVHVPVDASAMPRDRGTIEFWMQPSFSSTDTHLLKPHFSHHHQQLFAMGPVLITHDVFPDSEGHSSGYNHSRLEVVLERKQGAATYPVRLYLREGRRYHVAVTWLIDGDRSDVEVFVNGRRKTYSDHRAGVPYNLKSDDLAASQDVVKFGTAISTGYIEGAGNVFDELRISDTMRYTDTFTPPLTPFIADDHTVLLMHMDGNLDASGHAARGPGVRQKEHRLR